MSAQTYARRMRAHFGAHQARYPLTDVRAVGWGSRESQEERFRVLCEIGALQGTSLLDIGCGAADLYAYLTARGWRGHYHGVDLVPRIVDHAKSRFPGIDVTVRDVTADALEGSYDYVVASGILFLPAPNWPRLVTRVLNEMMRVARRGVAANFLSRYGGTSRRNYRADPARVLTLCLTRVTPRAVLRHDYRTNDFTVYLYPTGNKNLS